MATSIRNQASLTYSYGNSTGNATSNVATTFLEEPVTISKRALETEYRDNGFINYSLILRNAGTIPINNVTITDNLGEYELTAGTDVKPLTYVGPADLYTDSVFTAHITPAVGILGIVFTIASVAAQSSVMILYKAQVNEYARLIPETSVITNVVTASAATGLAAPVTTKYEIPVASYADVQIEKFMAPNPVQTGDVLTYTFLISNYGNIEATGIVVTDAFDTLNSPENLSVTIDGIPVTDFSYANSVLTISKAGPDEDITIEAAAITQNATTGVVTVTPSQMTIQVTGTI